jgi:hypothetical protein
VLLVTGAGAVILTGNILNSAPRTAPEIDAQLDAERAQTQILMDFRRTHDLTSDFELPAQPPVYEVRLNGRYGPTASNDPKIAFTGGCWMNGTFASVRGTTPAAYRYTGERAPSCTYQKRGGNTFEFQVTITRDGTAVQQATTDAEYGMVSLTG